MTWIVSFSLLDPEPDLAMTSIQTRPLVMSQPFTAFSSLLSLLSQAIASVQYALLFTFLSPLLSRSHDEPVKVIRMVGYGPITFSSDLNQSHASKCSSPQPITGSGVCSLSSNFSSGSEHCFCASLEGLTCRQQQNCQPSSFSLRLSETMDEFTRKNLVSMRGSTRGIP